MTLRVYNGDEVDIVWGPIIVEGGLGPDEFVRIEMNENITDDEAGVDGEVAVSRLNDGRADITIILMQTSTHNDEFSTLFNLALSAPGMAGAIQPLVVKDKNGRALYEADNAYPRSFPTVGFARKAGTREWGLRADKIKRTDGGN